MDNMSSRFGTGDEWKFLCSLNIGHYVLARYLFGKSYDVCIKSKKLEGCLCE